MFEKLFCWCDTRFTNPKEEWLWSDQVKACPADLPPKRRRELSPYKYKAFIVKNLDSRFKHMVWEICRAINIRLMKHECYDRTFTFWGLKRYLRRREREYKKIVKLKEI